jgi:hypothetical protein
MRRLLHIVGLWAGLHAAWGVSAVAQTPPTPAPVMPNAVAPKVDIGVMVISASATPGPTDARLSALLPTLRTLPFQSFTLIDEKAVRLTDGASEAVVLSGDRRLRVQLLSHDAKEARVRVELMAGEVQVVDTTISIHRDRSFYVAVRSADGATLILPVSVRY